ncbi:MAG: metallophosphoesterase [Actinobacteria bacterium]|nr:metallophosphoesterase [Actinomycetota bacterium]
MEPVRFVVVADSHIRLPDDGGAADYPSNALLADRNRRVVEWCNRLRPDFVVHLGDIVHPLPGTPGHEPAVALAAEIYAALDAPVHFVPGNHDIGDKPDSLVAAPAVADEHYRVFEAAWGAPHRSFDRGGCHVAIVDTPVLGSGLAREADQRSWLEADLAAAAAAGKRIFLCTHYPPFVLDPGEPEHYDNLAPGPRRWLVDLCRRHGVAAVLSGHVHNFGANRIDGTDYLMLPSTGFARPDYSELAAIGPEREGGRDAPARLGMFVVEADGSGHRVRPFRTYGLVSGEGPLPPETAADAGWEAPLGVTLRHGWATPRDLPTDGLDEFRRKRARDDAPLLALWEARIGRIRVPVGDVLDEAGRRRLRDLAAWGVRPTVVSAGVPDPPTLGAIESLAGVIERWELILPPGRLDRIPPSPVRLAVAPVVPVAGPLGHFVSHGFDPGGALPDLPCDDLTFRIPPDRPAADAIAAAAAAAARAGKGAVANVQTPRATEHACFDDDETVAARVAEAAAAARAHAEVAVYLDTFMDHDRGYYPRHGLIDRRGDPRPALYALVDASRA